MNYVKSSLLQIIRLHIRDTVESMNEEENEVWTEIKDWMN